MECNCFMRLFLRLEGGRKIWEQSRVDGDNQKGNQQCGEPCEKRGQVAYGENRTKVRFCLYFFLFVCYN